MNLHNAHVLVTGASSGIGAALAEAAAAKGARLSIVARRGEALRALNIPGAHIIEKDLVDDSHGWLPALVSAQGPVDVLINNAGVQVIAPTESVDVEQGERSLHLNLQIPLRLIREVLPSMLARRRGSIVNITSLAALAPTPGMTYYNASKAGLAGASEALSGEMRGRGVGVVTVYPGIIQTAMADSGRASYRASRAIDAQPVGTPERLATFVLRAVEKNEARVIYPRFNILARHFPAVTRWMMDRFAPPLI
jgi:short-subunit dehydrogenase